MNHAFTARTMSPVVAFIAAIALVLAAVLAGALASAGPDQRGRRRGTRPTRPAPSWNSTTSARRCVLEQDRRQQRRRLELIPSPVRVTYRAWRSVRSRSVDAMPHTWRVSRTDVYALTA